MNVILDLDETLINTHLTAKFTQNHYRRAKLFRYKHMERKYVVIARPGLDAFLDWLFERFTVTIWTAATRSYAHFVVKHFIMTKPGRTPLYIFSSRHCDASQRLGACHKDLSLLFKLFPEQYNRTNTLLVDDREDVCRDQHANTYRIPPFHFLRSQSYNDCQLTKLKRFLAPFCHHGLCRR